MANRDEGRIKGTENPVPSHATEAEAAQRARDQAERRNPGRTPGQPSPSLPREGEVGTKTGARVEAEDRTQSPGSPEAAGRMSSDTGATGGGPDSGESSGMGTTAADEATRTLANVSRYPKPRQRPVERDAEGGLGEEPAI